MPPQQVDVDVDPPLFGDLDSAPDELIVHIDPAEVSPATTDRINTLRTRLGLTTEEVKRLSSLGTDNIEAIKDLVEQAITERARLTWSGRPEYAEILAVCEVICAVRPAREFGVVSAKQLSMYLNELRKPGQIRSFFAWHANSFRGDQTRYESVFRFLRACEYSLPEYFACVELFVAKIIAGVDYSLFIAELPRWFRPEPLKILEEQGVPIQLAEKVIAPGDTVVTLSARLRALAAQPNSPLTALEQSWVLDALPT